MSEQPVRAFMGKKLDILPYSFVCFDIETTGLNPVYDDIIEISAVRVINGEICASFSQIINIHRPLPPFIVSLTGITDKMISKGRPAEDVLGEFAEFVGGDIVMGHNVCFDISFIYDNMLNRLGLVFENDYVDTLRISRRLLPQLKHHRLDDLVEYYGFTARREHRALGDVKLTAACYFAMLNEIENKDDFFSAKRRKIVK